MNYFSGYHRLSRDFDACFAAALSSKYSAKDCKKTPTQFTQLLIILQHMCALEGAIMEIREFTIHNFVCTLVTQPMLQRRPNQRELRLMISK